MATNTRNRRNAPEPDAPAETDTEVVPDPEVPVPDESPETDTEAEPTTDETDIPVLPADYVPNHPLVAEMLQAVIEAEAAKSEPTPISDFVAEADKLFKVPTGFATVEALIKAEADVESSIATYDAFKSFVDILRGQVEVRDRSEGQDLVDALVALVKLPKGGITDEADKAAIPVLAARWEASRPKGTSGTGSPRTGKSDIPFLRDVWETDKWRVRYECGTCKKTFSTGKDNLNSARNECIQHSKTHGQNKAEGTNDHKELTEGLYRNGLGNPTYKGDHAKADELVDSIQRGGWRIYTEK